MAGLPGMVGGGGLAALMAYLANERQNYGNQGPYADRVFKALEGITPMGPVRAGAQATQSPPPIMQLLQMLMGNAQADEWQRQPDGSFKDMSPPQDNSTLELIMQAISPHGEESQTYGRGATPATDDAMKKYWVDTDKGYQYYPGYKDAIQSKREREKELMKRRKKLDRRDFLWGSSSPWGWPVKKDEWSDLEEREGALQREIRKLLEYERRLKAQGNGQR